MVALGLSLAQQEAENDAPLVPRTSVVLVAMLAIAGTATKANAQDKLDRALRDGKSSGRSAARHRQGEARI